MSTFGETLFEALHNLYQQLLKVAVEDYGRGAENGGEKMGLAYLLFKTLGKFFVYGFKDPMNDLRARVGLSASSKERIVDILGLTEFLPRIDTELHSPPRPSTFPPLLSHFHYCRIRKVFTTAHETHLRLWEILPQSVGDGSYDI